jgi:hypothetical protein
VSKKPPPGQCVHCLKHSESLTWDHVFPVAWYPKTTPPNLEKWKIPACQSCNREYGRLEEDLLLRLGLSVDPQDQKSLGIADTALRSVNPLYASSDHDRQRRAAKRERILKELTRYDSVPTEGILPNFGPQPNLVYPDFGAIPISEDYLIRLGQKIIRGLIYLVEHSFIDDRYRISVYMAEAHKVQQVVSMIESYGVVYDRGPGIVVTHAKTSEAGGRCDGGRQ